MKSEQYEMCLRQNLQKILIKKMVMIIKIAINDRLQYIWEYMSTAH